MSLWPGERNPGRYDVRDANELPDSSFLQLFKSALLSSGTAIESTQGQKRSTQQILRSATTLNASASGRTHDGNSSNLTYPAALLENCPRIPLAGELEALRTAFFEGFKNHVFLASASIPGSSHELVPPYLDLSFACLAATQLQASFESNPTGVGSVATRPADIFLTATRLWGVMLEVDNREARRIEAVVAVALLSTYGVMSADSTVWQNTSIQLGYMEPIVRRLGMHDVQRKQSKPKHVTNDAADQTGPLMMYIFLLDTVRALHFNTTTLFITSELFLPMPDAAIQFHIVYSNLVAEVPEIPEGLSQNDGLFLLVALTADLIFINKSLQGILQEADNSSINPFIPLSPKCEQRRMFTLVSKSLDCWSTAFARKVNRHTLALYNFCRLLHTFPQVCDLPKLAGYASSSHAPTAEALYRAAFEASDSAADYAWQILENASSYSTQSILAPIWLPIVTFLAALTIWNKLKIGNSRSKPGMGSLRVLSLFKSEIERMKWPCCQEMSHTLHSLMGIPGAP